MLLFQNNQVSEVYAYNMIVSQNIIDNDLLLNRNVSKLNDLEFDKTESEDNVYEAVPLTQTKEIITFVSKDRPKVKRKPNRLIINDYKVKEGESLWSISKNFDITQNTIIAYNKLKSNKIYIGQKLKIPNLDGIFITVKKGDNLSKLSKSYKSDIKNIIKYNKLKKGSFLKLNQKLFIPGKNLHELKSVYKYVIKKRRKRNSLNFLWPTTAKRISSPFGYRIHPVLHRRILHTGVDIAGPVGTKIFASESGRVYYKGWIRGYGRVIIIKHKKGYSTYYAHLHKYLVRLNQYVERGQLIAYMGRTGRVTGPHLHFEVRKYGKPYNPLNYISRR